MAIMTTYNFDLRPVKTLTVGRLDVSGQGTRATLNATSTPPVSNIAGGTRVLVASADAIDLTAVEDHSGAEQDFTGLKLQAVWIKADADNEAASTVTFEPGSSNGYDLFGASGQITLGPGDECMFVFQDSLEDVSGTAKAIDVSSSGDATAAYSITLVAG